MDVFQNALGELRNELDVWRDVDAIKPGDRWAEKIDQALTEADFFVLIVSQDSLSSVWVQREIDTAVGLADKKKLTVLPIILSAVEVPIQFRGLLYIDGRSSVAHAAQKLVEFLRSQFETLAEIEPREMMRKSMDEKVLAWKKCQDKLRELQLRRLRFHLTEKLTIQDVRVLWFDLFEKKMDDEVAAQNQILALCCVELLDRSRREDTIIELLDLICRNHPRIAASL